MVILVSNKEVQEIAPWKEATRSGAELVPAVIRNAGPQAVESYLCFFTKMSSKHAGFVCRSATRSFLDWCSRNGLPLAEIRAGHVTTFFDKHRNTWKSSTAKVYFGTLKRLFGHLEADHIIERSPFVGVPAPKAPRTVAQHGTLQDLKDFLFELDHIKEGSTNYRPGLVAMYPVIIGGMDIKKIAAHTGVPMEEAELYAKRLRENSIWLDDGMISVTFDQDDDIATFVVEMVLIVGCAAGVFARFPTNERAA